MKKLVYGICIILIIFVNILFLCLVISNFLPAKMQHPCPTLTRKFPVLKIIDELLCLTIATEWYKVKDLKTGKLYIVKFSFDKNNGENIFIFDDETRGDVEAKRISRKEYLARFEQPIFGEGFSYKKTKQF